VGFSIGKTHGKTSDVKTKLKNAWFLRAIIQAHGEDLLSRRRSQAAGQCGFRCCGLLVAQTVAVLQGQSRLHALEASISGERMVWEDRVDSLTPAEFTRTYRVSLNAFRYVLERIRAAIKAPRKARYDTNGPVPAELLLSMTLRYLAGGSYLDIYQMHGVGRSTMFHAIPHVCHAICKAFPLVFPINDPAALVSNSLSLHSVPVDSLPR